ncbi:serine hydrolase domain-containing protein [Algoriphagus antarcticus]|nr:serine hydrolase domain-containing protein [Algoriphagus antarcticus]
MKTILTNKFQFFYATILLLAAFTSCIDKEDDQLDMRKPTDKQEDLAVIDGKIETFLSSNSIPGAVLAISKNGKLVYKKAYGLADVASQEKMTNSHRLRVASVSKTFTGLSIVKLVQDGKIRLEDKVFGEDGILGNEYGTKPYSDRVKKVTVQNLLHMTTGGWVVNGNRDAIDYKQEVSNKVFFDWMLDNATLTFEPGTQYWYINTNYFVAARIIEKVSGKSFYNFMKDNFLDELGIKSAVMVKNGLAGKQSNEVTYYGLGGTKGYEYNFNIERRDGDAGIVISAEDLLKFALAIDGKPSRPDILNGGSYSQFIKGSIPNPQFGIGILSWGDVRSFYGALPGTRSSYMIHNNGMAISLIFNGNADYTGNNYNNFATAHENLLIDILTKNLNIYQDIDQF